MDFGQNLKDLCIDKNINLKQLSKLINIQDSLLYKYEKGKSMPTLDNLTKIANFFNCTISYLVSLSDTLGKETLKNNPDKSIFFKRYSDLVSKNNLTHYVVCKNLGISISSIRNWRLGAIPYIDTLIKLSTYFNVSVDYLLGRSNNE